MPVARRSTSGRSSGSFQARPRFRTGASSHSGPAGARLTSTLAPAIITVSLLGAFVTVTGPGRAIAAGVLRFLLFYGGVFALIAMTASVGIGLVATDRIIMKPGHRITAQAVHRAVSLAALAFLVIHIWLEIAAARSQVADAVIPFLARERTFYIGLGTIASDLILVIVASGFLRAWFAGLSRPWAWRAVHASAYLSWLLSILHGLLGGRHAKAYVDWSYGACVAAVALALTVRMVAANRSREEVALAADPAAGRAMPALAQASFAQSLPGLPVSRALPAGPVQPATGFQNGGYAPGPRAGGLLAGATAMDLPAVTGTGRPAGYEPAAAPVTAAGLLAAAGPGTGPQAALAAPDAVTTWPHPEVRTGQERAPHAASGPAAAAGLQPAASGPPPGSWQVLRPQPPVWDTQRPAPSPWDTQRPGMSPGDGGRPGLSRWDAQRPGPSPWDDPRPAPSVWDSLRPGAPSAPAPSPAPSPPQPGRHSARPAAAGPPSALGGPAGWDSQPAGGPPWGSQPAGGSPWDDLRPAPPAVSRPAPPSSPWDRLRAEEPPGPAGAAQAADPLPRRTPGARHPYGGPAR